MYIVLLIFFLLCVNTSFAIFMVSYFKAGQLFKGWIKSAEAAYQSRRVRQEGIRLLRRNNLKPGLRDRLEIQFIDKSNLRSFIPFADINLLFVISGIVFIVSMRWTGQVFLFTPTSIVISIFLALVPLMLLDILGRYHGADIRKRLCDFISCVSRWLSVREDLFYAFERSAPMMHQPLQGYLDEMNIQIKMGVSPEDALDYLAMKVDNAHFKDFVINVKGNIRCRGDIRKLVRVLERQFYELEKEFARRNISSAGDKILLYVVAGISLALCLYMLLIVPAAREFYTTTGIGKLIMLMYSFLFAGGTMLFGLFSKNEGSL